MTNTGRTTTAMIFIGVGVAFLLAQFVGGSFLSLLWPLFILVPGVAFLFFATQGEGKQVGLAVPGAMITGTGAILFYQNLTNHWGSWAYVWALYPVFLGLALVFIGRRTGNENALHTGDGFVKWGLIGFIGLWAFFELLIFGGNNFLVTTVVPLALIGAGVFMLMRGRKREKMKFTYSDKPKSTNGHRKTYSENLQDKIDAALAEDDELI